MKRAIAVVALVLVIGSIPPTVARHRSVGVEDQAAVSPEDEPTVPNAEQIEGDPDVETPYEVGITSPSECTKIHGNLTEAGMQRATTADEYCGELVYNEDLHSSLKVVSPPDQDIPSLVGGMQNPVGSFDVVRSDMFGVPGGLTLCTPFCPPGGLTNLPGGNQRHQIFYDTMAQTGLTHDSDTTDEKQRENRRNYGSAQLAYPNAGQTVQAQTGMWEMNGWANPNAFHTFVGFLEDEDGDPISDDQLSTILDNADLPNDAVPRVCGFTEDRVISTTKSDNFCEVELKYYEPEEDQDATFKEYGDRCKSPTYVCNAAAGPAWRMSPPAFFGSVAHPAMGTGEDVIVPGVGGLQFGDGDNFVTWHWVVAPNPQDCAAQEPVVSFDSGKASAPYLAHDLDTYVPVTRLSSADTPSSGSVERYAEGVASGPIETVLENVQLPGPVEEQVENANELINETNRQASALQNETVGETVKDHRVEPNANPAMNPLSDTSQSHVEVAQAPLSPCQRAVSGQDTDTVDPWVDIVDSEVQYTRTTSALGITVVDGQQTLYNNSDPDQDDDNNPGPARISTAGTVGLFTDNNDDGDYETTGDPYRPGNIVNAGAYPMIWNVKVDRTGATTAEITGEGSCEFTGTQTIKLSLDAKRIGYGPNTGLFQLVYLNEPTVASADLLATQNREPYPGGNNIYLLASQSVRELTDRDWDDAKQFPLEAEVDAAVNALQNWVVDNTEAQAKPPVQMPGSQFGFDTDFNHQCLASTGGFSSKISFLHDCQALNCEGDTIVTRYVFEVTTEDGRFTQAGEAVPSFHGLNDRTEKFGGFDEFNSWTDVDPFDGDPDRNDDQTDRPPT